MIETKITEQVRFVRNTPQPDGFPEFLSASATDAVRALHETLDRYRPTPLISLESFAKRAGVRAVLVKDESKRFGLNAFKGLGGVYAMFRIICEALHLAPEAATVTDLKSPDHQKAISEMTFVTTTDGNHGKGVSWAAKLFGAKARVYMPRGSAEVRAQAIRDAGNASVEITNLGYDDCVRYTARLAEENEWFLVQDTAWEGYETIPSWIIQGYTTLFYEADRQMKASGIERPTHIFLQAGVGAMAGGIMGAAACTYRDALPSFSVVEPKEAACIYESALSGDGAPHRATGSEETMMAGLNCSEPCTLTWPILRSFAGYFFSCSDAVAAHGMRFYSAPAAGDERIVSGESGAVTGGLVSLLLTKPEYRSLREEMKLNDASVILLINTEGDTDPENYRNIVFGSTEQMRDGLSGNRNFITMA